MKSILKSVIQYINSISCPHPHIQHPVQPSLNIKSGKRHTAGGAVNIRRAVITLQVQGVSSVKMEYKSTASWDIIMISWHLYYDGFFNTYLGQPYSRQGLSRRSGDVIPEYSVHSSSSISPPNDPLHHHWHADYWWPGVREEKTPVQMSRSPTSVLVEA